MSTIGRLLQEEREKRGLTLLDVEKATKIRKKQLSSIEKGIWSGFSSRTYIQGIIKLYGNFLGLPEEKLLAFFRREYEKKDNPRFKQKIETHHYTPITTKVFFVLMALAGFIFLSYFGYQIKVYLSPPTVTILSPQTLTIKRQSKFELVGQTEKDSSVQINGRDVYLDGQNQFSTMISIPDKRKEVTIIVTGANGKKTVVKKTYIKE